MRPLLSVACLAAALTLTSAACGDKSDDTGEGWGDGTGSSSWVTRNFLDEAEGSSSGGALSVGCEYTFHIYVIPDESDDVEISNCTLTFELEGEIDARNKMTLTGPSGASQELFPPDESTLEIEADDFAGDSGVNGDWTLTFEDRFDCDVIERVVLEVEGTYRGP